MAKQTKPRTWWLVMARSNYSYDEYIAAHTTEKRANRVVKDLKESGFKAKPPIKVVEMKPTKKVK